jgi:hypothetical protein
LRKARSAASFSTQWIGIKILFHAKILQR